MQYLRTLVIALVCCGGLLTAQPGEAPLRTFGYFQNQFENTSNRDGSYGPSNSFLVQQLNLFFQKNLARDWSAFVNFELLNNYSSGRQWGSFNLEEAWVRYRSSKQINLKLGLQIPLFNNLNEVKNRTPLIPYIIRPLVYESSFNEMIPLEEFVPQQAFVQVYGYIPSGGIKIEHAVYLGNSPNINNDSERGQTGVDTTDNLLAGGRLGIRYDEFRAGLSGTYEKISAYRSAAGPSPGTVPGLRDLPRYRLGGDISFRSRKLFLESEFIRVMYQDVPENIDIDKTFYYGTLGWFFADNLLAYGSYWYIHFDDVFAIEIIDDIPLRLSVNYHEHIRVPGVGLAYHLNDRITLKGQYVYVDIQVDFPNFPEATGQETGVDFQIITFAASVMF